MTCQGTTPTLLRKWTLSRPGPDLWEMYYLLSLPLSSFRCFIKCKAKKKKKCRVCQAERGSKHQESSKSWALVTRWKTASAPKKTCQKVQAHLGPETEGGFVLLWPWVVTRVFCLFVWLKAIFPLFNGLKSCLAQVKTTNSQYFVSDLRVAWW